MTKDSDSRDEDFMMPELARSFWLYCRVVVWLSGIAGVINAFFVLRSSLFIGCILIVSSIAFICGGLMVARIVYECLLVHFEQLKVQRQIRDSLAKKKNLDSL